MVTQLGKVKAERKGVRSKWLRLEKAEMARKGFSNKKTCLSLPRTSVLDTL